MQTKSRLEELLLELDDSSVTTDFWCAHCHDEPQLEIEELHALAYKLRCGRCGGSVWGGARASLWWNVTGFEGVDEIYHEDIELDPDTLKSHLQDLAKQHLVRGDRNKPALWEVSLNRGAPRLSYVCGVDPHYVAIAIEPEE